MDFWLDAPSQHVHYRGDPLVHRLPIRGEVEADRAHRHGVLRAGGMAIRDEDLVHVWPLQRRHITPNGVYFANRTLPAFVLPEPLEA